jgi:cell wall-associated NlpC family hydrolase
VQPRPTVHPGRPTARRPRLRLVAALTASLVLPLAAPPASAAVPVGASAGLLSGGADGVDTPELRRLRERAAAAQRDLVAATTAYAESERRLAEARVRADEARGRADAARVEVARLKQIVQDYAAAAYKGGVGNDFVVVLGIVTSGSTRALDGAGYVDRVRKGQNDDLDGLRAAEEEAAEQSGLADEWLRRAQAEEAELARRAAEVQALSAAASGELTAHLQVVDAALAAATAEQAARGAGALARWQAYLDRLLAAKVVPPPAAALADPRALPAGLSAVAGPDGAPSAGVAEVTDAAGLPLRVLPAETVDAVTRALGEVGKPYRSGARGPEAFDCGGLVASVYGGLAADPGDQFAVTRPVPAAAAEVGDLVFLGGEKLGLTSVGVYVGEGEIVTAGRPAGSVQVAEVPEGGVLGHGRATLTRRPPVAAPAPRAGVGMECGGFDAPASGSAAWGGFPNGLIPPSALCPVGAAPGHRFRCDAAATFDAMATAYRQEMGRPICVTDSYRTYAAQVDVYARKPGLAAVPGTSNHGWALAVDFCGGVESFGTPAHEWMRARAGAFGWVHPGWAQAGGSKPEAWHWEFGHR